MSVYVSLYFDATLVRQCARKHMGILSRNLYLALLIMRSLIYIISHIYIPGSPLDLLAAYDHMCQRISASATTPAFSYLPASRLSN